MSQILIQCIREHSDLNECNYVDSKKHCAKQYMTKNNHNKLYSHEVMSPTQKNLVMEPMEQRM